jgi:protein SCO1
MNLLLALVLCWQAGDHSAAIQTPGSRLARIQKAPDFDLVTQEGRALRRSDLNGKVLLVSFVFTSCNGTCPATTHRMSQVQDELKKRGLLREGRVRLLSISLDPVRDTPDVLRSYMKLYDADATTWTFLTGPQDAVKAALSSWGMWARPAANGQLDHPSRVFLVGPRGFVREIYNLDFLKPIWVAEDITLLLNERP